MLKLGSPLAIKHPRAKKLTTRVGACHPSYPRPTRPQANHPSGWEPAARRTKDPVYGPRSMIGYMASWRGPGQTCNRSRTGHGYLQKVLGHLSLNSGPIIPNVVSPSGRSGPELGEWVPTSAVPSRFVGHHVQNPTGNLGRQKLVRGGPELNDGGQGTFCT